MGLWDRIAAGERDYYDVNDDGRVDSFEAGMMMYQRDLEESGRRGSYDSDILDELCELRDVLDIGDGDIGDFGDF